MRRAHALALANSAYTAETLRSPVARALVFHLGVDAARFDPEHADRATRAELGLAEDDAVAIIAGRIVKNKGQELTVRALRVALDREPALMEPFRLAILGGPLDSPDGVALRETIEQTRLGDRVRLHGHSDRPERVIAASDFMMNSRTDAEPFGLSIIEAMMLGKPVLAHALGGPAETVADGITGWHISAPTVSAYADGLIRAMRDRARWAEIGGAGRARAMERFTVTAQLARYREAIDPLLR
jgi:glycosyltransferase involved in cell wall biosynthesis